MERINTRQGQYARDLLRSDRLQSRAHLFLAKANHTKHRLQTALTMAQEVLAVVFRRTLLESLNDLLAVVREFLNPDVARAGLDRCLWLEDSMR